MSRRRSLVAALAVVGVGVLSVAGAVALGATDPSTETSVPSAAGAAVTTAVPTTVPAPTPSTEPESDASFDTTAQTDPAPTTVAGPPDDSSESLGTPVDEAVRAELEDAAGALLEDVLPVVAHIDAEAPFDVSPQLEAVASEAVMSEIEAERLEFETEGWSREGNYIIDGIEVLSYAESGAAATATVRICLDASEIVVRRSDGTVVEPDPKSQRAWNVYSLERSADEWRIVGRTLTDDPAC